MTVEELNPKVITPHPHSSNVVDSPVKKTITDHETESSNGEISLEEPTYEDEFSSFLASTSLPKVFHDGATEKSMGKTPFSKGPPPYSLFPKYRRQYKVESIYVNDLYTLTYDEGETLESLKAIEVHYRRADREEIRRKLAMGTDEDSHNERLLKKPSLHSRLQSGKNLQICFMNETASDCESQCSDTESTQDRIDEMEGVIYSKESKLSENDLHSMDFVSHQARLQAEARLALAQAKEMARMQMEIEKQNQKKSPITEIVRDSFNKIGFPFPASKRRMSRQILTDMNVGQLQVIVNDLHTQIENLNEGLVQLLLTRDDLHMEQDSMLVDIEDLTKHLGAKQRANTLATSTSLPDKSKPPQTEIFKGSLKPPPTKTLKLKALVKK